MGLLGELGSCKLELEISRRSSAVASFGLLFALAAPGTPSLPSTSLPGLLL